MSGIMQLAINALRDMLEAEPDVMHKLAETRFPCTRAIEGTTAVPLCAEDQSLSLGFLGVLNGVIIALCGPEQRIAGVFDTETGKLTDFAQWKAPHG